MRFYYMDEDSDSGSMNIWEDLGKLQEILKNGKPITDENIREIWMLDSWKCIWERIHTWVVLELYLSTGNYIPSMYFPQSTHKIHAKPPKVDEDPS